MKGECSHTVTLPIGRQPSCILSSIPLVPSVAEFVLWTIAEGKLPMLEIWVLKINLKNVFLMEWGVYLLSRFDKLSFDMCTVTRVFLDLKLLSPAYQMR